jgi:hypothetical protein
MPSPSSPDKVAVFHGYPNGALPSRRDKISLFQATMRRNDSPNAGGIQFDNIIHGGQMMEKTINDKDYPQQYTWTRFISHVLVVFILLIGLVQVIKALSE